MRGVGRAWTTSAYEACRGAGKPIVSLYMEDYLAPRWQVFKHFASFARRELDLEQDVVAPSAPELGVALAPAALLPAALPSAPRSTTGGK